MSMKLRSLLSVSLLCITVAAAMMAAGYDNEQFIEEQFSQLDTDHSGALEANEVAFATSLSKGAGKPPPKKGKSNQVV